MPDSINVVSRFAPSPTGYLHVGGARTALFSWLLARHHGGKFLLRIEDTDLARSTQQACDQLLEDLRWLGLHWDNELLVFQSKRLDIYNRLIEELMSRGLAYKAYETSEELNAMRDAARREKREFIYRRREISEADLQKYASENRPYVIRFAMEVREHRYHDAVLDKEILLPSGEVQDLIIRKTDGMPTFHFAVVVDDAEAGTTHILRGQEHLKNTFAHIAIQEALGYPRPVYGHLPIIMNMDGSKMGKRDRDKKIRQSAQLWIKSRAKSVDELSAACGLAVPRLEEWIKDSQKQLDLDEQLAVMNAVGLKDADLPEILVHDFRKNGYLPETLLNFLALLGWNPGGDRERMSMDEMVQLFSIEGIGKGNAKFARDKLLAFNTEACAAASPQRLLAGMRDYLSVNPDSPLNGASDDELAKLLAMKKGFRLLREVDESARFFFVKDSDLEFDPQAIEKVLKKNDSEGFKVLSEIREILAIAASWKAHDLESAVKQFVESKGLQLGKVAQPIRVAISGTSVSPPIFESLEFLGKQRSLARIDRCLALVIP